MICLESTSDLLLNEGETINLMGKLHKIIRIENVSNPRLVPGVDGIVWRYKLMELCRAKGGY
jgi:hypothetical protein